MVQKRADVVEGQAVVRRKREAVHTTSMKGTSVWLRSSSHCPRWTGKTEFSVAGRAAWVVVVGVPGGRLLGDNTLCAALVVAVRAYTPVLHLHSTASEALRICLNPEISWPPWRLFAHLRTRWALTQHSMEEKSPPQVTSVNEVLFCLQQYWPVKCDLHHLHLPCWCGWSEEFEELQAIHCWNGWFTQSQWQHLHDEVCLCIVCFQLKIPL